jgi:hypothetical protein
MPSEKAYLTRVQERTATWIPQSKPQWQALLSRADELFYGGAAGGGKTSLLIGLAAEMGYSSAIFRRVYPNLKEIIRQMRDVIGGRGKENKADRSWAIGKRTIEFGAVQHEDDKKQWQGRPHDHKLFDEITEFTESQYEFICGWSRTTIPGQRVRVVVTGNPPIDEDGSWVMRRWGAWVDRDHPHPAKAGELRWYATVAGKEIECEDGEPFAHEGETIYPRSRTFIPAKLEDNPFLSSDPRYRSVLQSLPEPLRSMFLNGDFQSAAAPDPFQVIPSEWVRAAQRRWMERERPKALPAFGLDPSRGGQDKTALAARYDNWFDEPMAWPGVIAKDGPTVAELVRQSIGGGLIQYINVDVTGIGSSVYDSLNPMYDSVYPFVGAEKSGYRDRSGKLKMRNKRAEMYWRMRDALDPDYGDDIALPPDTELLADLCSAKYTVTTAGVLIEPKDKIKERIGRSPDIGEAVMMANMVSTTVRQQARSWSG